MVHRLVWWLRRNRARTTVAGAVLLCAALRATTGSGVPVDLLSGVLVAGAVVGGPAVALGGAGGVLLGDAAAGSVGAWTLFDAVGVASVPLGVCLLWGHAGLVAPGARPTMRSAHEAAEYLVVVALSAVVALAAEAWLAAALGFQPFYAGYEAFLADAALAALVGLLALRVLSRVAPESVGVVAPRPDDRVGPRRVAAAFALGAGWFLVETGIAAVTHDLRLYENAAGVTAEARSVFGSGLVGGLLERVLLLFWSAGDVVVTVVGVVAAAGLVFLLLTRELRDPSSGGVSAD